MLAWIESLGPWFWVVLGLVLAGLELLAPGVFLIWLGLAALLTGLADWAFGLSWQGSSLTFAALSVASVVLGRQLTRSGDDPEDGTRGLSRRGHALVGQTFTLEAAVVGGEGRVRVGDSSWRVLGPDAPAGARVRVVRVDGTNLVVEPA